MKQLKEDLKNQTFHPVYLLYGEEDYLKRMYRDRLKKAVLGDGDEMNYSYFEGKDIFRRCGKRPIPFLFSVTTALSLWKTAVGLKMHLSWQIIFRRCRILP